MLTKYAQSIDNRVVNRAPRKQDLTEKIKFKIIRFLTSDLHRTLERRLLHVNKNNNICWSTNNNN